MSFALMLPVYGLFYKAQSAKTASNSVNCISIYFGILPEVGCGLSVDHPNVVFELKLFSR
eukprot:2305362-Pleurochrysis_carterae.AAC.1